MRPTLALLLCLQTAPCLAATLRGATTLDRPMVRISDLFDDAGMAGERVLGPGPAPGGRIVVEVPQLTAIARQFGVPWRAGQMTDRVVIDRPGKFVPREVVMATLREALTHAGATADADIDVPGLVTPLVGQEASPQTTIEQIDYDRAGGRFTATLAIAVEAEPIQRMRLSGSVREMAETVVTTHRLVAGSVIRPEDLTTRRQRADPSRDAVVRDPRQAIGLAVRRIAPAGQTIPLTDLTEPLTIQKGARVTMELFAPGLSLTGVGQALEAGALGARISVMNTASRAVVEAEILGPDRVRVAPDSVPRLPRSPSSQVSQR